MDGVELGECEEIFGFKIFIFLVLAFSILAAKKKYSSHGIPQTNVICSRMLVTVAGGSWRLEYVERKVEKLYG